MTSFARRALVPAVHMTVIAAVLSGGALGSAGTASAAITADAGATATATTGTWSATLHDPAGQASTAKPVTMAWQITTPPVYLTVRNTGALPLTGQTYTLTRTGFTTSYNATVCVDSNWNHGGNCPSGDTLLLDTTTTASGTSVDLPLAPGESTSIKVTATRSGTATVTLSVAVARNQTRAATTTNA
jgi:hypothetical protein